MPVSVLLPEPLSDKVAHLPETGMGYQIVDIDLSNGHRLHCVLLYNGVELDVADEALSGADIVDVELSRDQRRSR